MFKVECLGCQAPYQVDERRVPAAGLQMRCPKCGTSFKVESPAGAAAEPDEKAVANVALPFAPVNVTPATKPVGREALSRTMIGVTSAVPAVAKAPFRMPRPGQEVQPQPPAKQAEPDVPEVVVSQPDVSQPEAAESMGSMPGAAESQVDEQVVQGQLPAVLAHQATLHLEEAPQAVTEQASQPELPAVLDVGPEHEEDGPKSLAAPSRPLRLSELPVAVSRAEEDLPAAVEPAPPNDLPTVAFVDNLPAQVGAPPNAEGIDNDLPAMPVRPKRPPPPRRGKKNVPEIVQAQAELPIVRDQDLPVVAAAAQVSDLPATAVRVSDVSAQLPALAGAGLPQSLESPVGLGDLPSVLGGGSAQSELPSVLGGAVVAAELPSPVHVDMPSPVGGTAGGFGRVALPEVHAGLPTVQAALPDVHGALPEIQSALPNVQSALPEIQAVLPEIQEVLPEVQGEELGASGLPVVGEVLPAILGDSAWDGVAAGKVDDAFGDNADFSFGDTGAGPASGFSFPPDGAAFGDSQPPSDGDPFASVQLDAPEESDDESSEGFGMEATFPLEAEGSQESSESAEQAGYGEVSIAGEAEPEQGTGLDTADDMEFGDIPQEQTGGLGDVEDPGSDREAPGATLELDGERKRPARRLERRVAIAVALGLGMVGGGAMSLQSQLGPFGIHYVMDEVQRSDNERTLSTLRTEAQASFDKDTLDDARAAIALAEAAVQRSPRFSPYGVHLTTLLSAAALRFGPLSEMEAAGKAALTGLKEQSPSVELRLARAAARAARLEEKSVKELESVADKWEAKMLLLELFLQLNRPEEALQVLAKTRDPKSPRVQFAAARAHIALGQWAQAFDRAGAVLALHPEHTGANIARLDARRGGYIGKSASASKTAKSTGEEVSIASLTKLVEETLPRAAPAERVLAHEVRGDIHLKYGRESQAQKEFEAALALKRQSPRALIGLGETLLLAGRHAEALARFEAAIAARPNDLRANLGVVEAQLALDHLGKANERIKGLLEKHPKNANVVYWQAKAEQALEHTEAALLAYRSAINLGQGKPESMRAYLALAQLEGRIGQTALAAATLNEARTSLPPSGLLLHEMGQAAMQNGKYASAFGFFEDAVKLDPEDTRARFLRAVALTRLSRFDEALRAFDAVKASDEAFPGLAMERGRLYEVSGRNAQALEQYEAAFSKTPDDEELKLRLGCARVVGGQNDKAVELLQELIRAMPRSAEVHYCLGRAFFEKRSYVKALSLLGKAVRLDESQAIYYLYEGWVANDVGKTAQAAASLDKALSLDNGLGDAYWLRGRLSRKQGAVKDAIKDLRRAQKLSPERVEVIADLATAYTDLGQRRRALSAWKSATERSPKNATWRFRYGKLLSAMGQGQRATAQLTLALRLAQPDVSPAGLRVKPTLAWVSQAHYLIARTMGRTKQSVVHWQAFLSGAPEDNPYRNEAHKALLAMGETWKKR